VRGKAAVAPPELVRQDKRFGKQKGSRASPPGSSRGRSFKGTPNPSGRDDFQEPFGLEKEIILPGVRTVLFSQGYVRREKGNRRGRRGEMSCMAAEDHEQIIRRVNLFHVKIHLFWVFLLVFAFYLPYHFRVQRDLLQDTVHTFQMEYSSIRMRHQMLDLLRTRPLTVGQAMDIADAVVQQNQVPVEVVFAVMQQESEFTPTAVSKKGARGLMQVMPVVWKNYSLPHFKNITDPVQNVHVGTLYLADLFQQFGDWKAVFRAYYAGPENHSNKEYDWYANAVLKKIYDFRRIIEN
jgi:hypothetical protein